MNSKVKAEGKGARRAARMKKSAPKRIRLMDYRGYATDPIHFRTWLDAIYARVGLSIPATSALIGAVVLLSGFLLAETFGFGVPYLRTKAIYIGIFGISLVSGMIRYASLNIHRVFEYVRPCFWVDDTAYQSFLARWFSRMSKGAGNAVFIALYGLLAVLLAVGEFLGPLENRVSSLSIKAYFFEPFWYTPENLWGKIALIAFYGICIAFPLGFATSLLTKNMLFMRELGDLPVIPSPRLIRTRFRAVVDFYLRIVFAWSIGIGLFGLVFFTRLDVWSVAFLSLMNLLGLAAFISPQLCYRKYLEQADRAMTRRALNDLYARVGIRLFERPALLPDSPFSDESTRHPALVHTWTDFLVLLAAQMIVYGTVFLGPFM